MALEHQVLPPNAGCDEPHRELTRDGSPLSVLDQGEAWPAGRPLRAAASAMGFGGINVHVVLEGAASGAAPLAGRPGARAPGLVAGRRADPPRRAGRGRSQDPRRAPSGDGFPDLPLRAHRPRRGAARPPRARLPNSGRDRGRHPEGARRTAGAPPRLAEGRRRVPHRSGARRLPRDQIGDRSAAAAHRLPLSRPGLAFAPHRRRPPATIRGSGVDLRDRRVVRRRVERGPGRYRSRPAGDRDPLARRAGRARPPGDPRRGRRRPQPGRADRVGLGRLL